MRVLVANAGSSSLKLRVVGPGGEIELSEDLGPPGSVDLGSELGRVVDACAGLDAVGHRVVHGGARFDGPVVIDDSVAAELAELASLAPLHNPPSLAVVSELRRRLPGVAQVACFDTAFHSRIPAAASTYALPARWRHEWGIRKYGFHGLSHSWASRRAAALLGMDPARLRCVVAHLGSGASLAAVAAGRSVDTTMGFTPIDGLVMATRSGSVDPGGLLWAMRRGALDPDAAEEALERHAGLLALSGRSGDLRQVLAGVDEGDPDCRLAYDVYVHRIATGVGAMAVAAGGMDALVFTGAAGAGSARLRADVCGRLGAVGVPVPSAHSDAAGARGGDRVVGRGAATAVVVVEAREDLEIARLVRALLAEA